MDKQILEILERVYSGSEHIGAVYNNEAKSKLKQLFRSEMKKIIGKNEPETRGVANTVRIKYALTRNLLKEELRTKLKDRSK